MEPGAKVRIIAGTKMHGFDVGEIVTFVGEDKVKGEEVNTFEGRYTAPRILLESEYEVLSGGDDIGR